jgi:hypothetical protein
MSYHPSPPFLTSHNNPTVQEQQQGRLLGPQKGQSLPVGAEEHGR